MGYRTRNLNQSCTYWERTGSDGKGWYTFSDPVLIDCRWEDTQEEFQDIDGNIRVSTSKVYVGQDLLINGYLALGDYTGSAYSDPKNVAVSSKISSFKKIPNLRGTTFVGNVWLVRK